MNSNKNMNNKVHLRIRTKLTRRIALFLTLSTIVAIAGILITLNLAPVKMAYGAVSGDYRTKASGAWNSATTWETYNGSAWVATATPPTSTNGKINILSGHSVTVTANVTVDQVEVDLGGSLTINSGFYLYVNNGADTDLRVKGILTINGTGYLVQNASSTNVVEGTVVLSVSGTHTLNSGASIEIANGGRFQNNGGSITTAGNWIVWGGGVYQHNVDGGWLPSASWQSGSTCEVTGVTSTIPGTLNQAYSNFVWDCPSQNVPLNFGGNFPSVTNNVTITSTGTSYFQFDQQGNNSVINVGNNMYMKGGNVYGCTNGGIVVNIYGSYIQSGGYFTFNMSGGAAYGNTSMVFNVFGDINISGGTCDLSQCSSNNSLKGNGIVNLSGNIIVSANGRLTETSGNSRGQIHFTKNGIQDITSLGTMDNSLDYYVENGATLRIDPNEVLYGEGNFTVESGGGMIIGSSQGISTTGPTGNIQVLGTRSYHTVADYTYNGVAAQISGNGLPSTVRKLTLENSNNLTLTNSVAVTSLLTLTTGKIITGSNEVNSTNTSPTSIVGHSSSNYIIGNLRRSVLGTGSYDYPLGTTSNYEIFNVTLASATGFSNILGNFVNANPIQSGYPLNNVFLNGTPVNSMLSYGYWSITPNSSMNGGSYSVTAKETGYSNSALNPSAYCVLKRNGLGSSWQSLGTHNNNTQSETGGTVTAVRSALTSFSHFGIGYTGGTLPIELVDFKATPRDNNVELSWVTGSEINNDYFTIERSVDRENFEKILTKPGAGNSTSTLYYNAVDSKPVNGLAYYRLKQTDYDGQFSYSAIKKVKFVSKENPGTPITIKSINPNPFNERFTVVFESSNESPVDFVLLNQEGRTISTDKFTAKSGMNEYQFANGESLKSGIYTVLLVSNNQKYSKTIIKN